jgi:hypothetical protein
LIETHGETVREHLFHFLLADIYKDELNIESAPFCLLKENAVFGTKKEKTIAIVSFSRALEQFCKSESASNFNIEQLFSHLQVDGLEKVIFALGLFTDVMADLIEQGRNSICFGVFIGFTYQI